MTTTPTALFQAGHLAKAIEAQIAEVRSHPGDHARRLFLFEMVLFSGDLDRAGKQIDALKYDSIELQAALVQYRKLLESEKLRRQAFRDGVKPGILGTDPPPHVELRWQAVEALRAGDQAAAVKLIDEANGQTGPLKGTWNGKPFELFRDCDDLFGTVMEVCANGSYFWIALEQVESISSVGPRFPRDVFWLPGRLETRETSGEVFMPALYPFSHEHSDEHAKVGKLTDWAGGEGELVRGVGARLFLAGDDAVSLIELRNLQLA